MFSKCKKPASRRERESGQSLVEMAITFPLLVLILSGLFDLGRVYFTFIALEEAAAEAALYLAIDTDCAVPNGHINFYDGTTEVSIDPAATYRAGLERCDSPNNALYRALTAGNGEFVNNLNRDFINESRLTQVPPQPVRARFNIEWDFEDYVAGTVPDIFGRPFDPPFEGADLGTPIPQRNIGNTVTVQVRYPYNFITPGIEAIANAVTDGEGLILETQATQLIVFE